MHIRWLGLLIVSVALVETVACRAAAARCDGLMNPEKLQSLERNDTLSKVEDSRGSGPKESFDRKRQGYDAVVGTEPIPELGLEARITKHDRAPTVMVRRSADVLYLMCADCSRDQSIALAKLAASP